MILLSIIVFCLGVIIGSFLNVVILRYNTGLSISHGRSKCFSCGKILSWVELIPIFSFIVQRGKCKGCNSNISWQYSIVELTTGLLFLFSFYAIASQQNLISFFGLLHLLLLWVIFSILIVITAYDFRHKIIPDSLSYTFSGISFLQAFIGLNGFVIPSLDLYIAGPIIALFFFLLWVITRGKGIGLGDAKLALGIGWFLGFSSGVASVFIAFWSGAVISLLIIAGQKIFGSKKVLGMKSAIPFGPFLVASLIICFFLSIDMSTLSSWLTF